MALQGHICFGIMTFNKEMIIMSYNAKADKKYNAKSQSIGIKFTPNESAFHDAIIKYCLDNGMSKQAFVKNAIREKLEWNGYL
jgi:hypothetical protein